MPRNNNPDYHYKRNGLYVSLYSSAKTGMHSRCVVSPKFVKLLYEIENGSFDIDLWDKLSQNEKNFMYDINRKCKINNKPLEMEHLNETNKLMSRLKLLDGSLMAGNYSKELLNEIDELTDELYSRHQLTAIMRTLFKKKINKIREQI